MPLAVSRQVKQSSSLVRGGLCCTDSQRSRYSMIAWTDKVPLMSSVYLLDDRATATVLLFPPRALTKRYKDGAISQGLRPSNHQSCQKLTRSPFPTEHFVAARNICVASFEMVAGIPDQALNGHVFSSQSISYISVKTIGF